MYQYLLIPFWGTMLGSGLVFLLRRALNPSFEKLMLGFASGVMVAASVWSLINPSIEMAQEQGIIPWLPASAGFLAGILFLLLIDSLVPHMHLNSTEQEGIRAELKKTTMLVLAVTMHNIPEGMAVGVIFAGLLSDNSSITLASAITLTVGIAIQNIPEGTIISMPLHSEGMSKTKAFLLGTLSGAVEPAAAYITIRLSRLVVPALPYLLAFAAGAMIYVVVEELIPESQSGKHSNIATIGMAAGFVVMMVLDVALG